MTDTNEITTETTVAIDTKKVIQRAATRSTRNTDHETKNVTIMAKTNTEVIIIRANIGIGRVIDGDKRKINVKISQIQKKNKFK